MLGWVSSLRISESHLVNALLAVLAFVVVAKAADLFVDKVVRRFAARTKSEVDDRVIDVLHRPVYHTIVLVGVYATALSLEPSPRLFFIVHGTVFSLVAVVWAVAAARTSDVVVAHAVHRVSDVTGLGKDVVPLVRNVLRIAIVAAALMAVLSAWRKGFTPILASAGVLGAAVAFASKDTLANFFGGISVFVDKPYKIGDVIVLDGGDRGEVVAIGVRSTRVRTFDDTLVTIPNSLIANSRVVNESAPEPTVRLRLPVAVAYGTDVDIVEGILLGIARANERVAADPAPRVGFREFGESALHLDLFCWAKEPALRAGAVDELNRAIYREFLRSGIRMPFPQRDVHLHRGAPGRPPGTA